MEKKMYYWFEYKRDYLVDMGLFFLIFFSICNFIILYCLQTIFIFILLIVFLFYIPLYCSFIVAVYQDLSKKFFSYILLIFLGLVLIMYSIACINLFLWEKETLFLLEFFIIIGTEFWIIYVSIYYISEKKNIINIEFDNKIIRIYKEQTVLSIYSIDQIKRVTFFHSYNIYSGENNIIKFKLNEKREKTLVYKSLTSEVIDFLYFLEKYCPNYNIFFKKIEESGSREKEIKNLKKFITKYDK